MVVAPLVYFFLADFPEQAKFLTAEEKHYVVARINNDIGRAPSNKLNRKVIMNVFKDWRVWCLYFPSAGQY